MLTGFNSDVTFEGVVYHVQSEDRGVETPLLDSLVYCGGQILHQQKESYQDLVDQGLEGSALEREVARRLDHQHRDLLRRARHGEFVAEETPSLAALLKTESPLTEALSEVLDASLQPLELKWKAARGGDGGLSGKLRVRRAGGKGAAGAFVTARLVGPGRDPAPLLEGEADEKGEISVALVLPPVDMAAVIFSAELEDAAGRLRLDGRALSKALASAGRAALAESPAPVSSS